MSARSKKESAQDFTPAIIAICIFFIMVFSTLRYTSYKRGEWEKDIRANLLETLTANKSKLERALYSRIYYTKGVAAYVSLHPEITNNDFQDLAKQLIKNDSVINTMSLSRNCIISSIFPEKGHEAAIGLDLMAHPQRREIVNKTIETHQTFVAGPVELVEGGIAFISYTPIFNKTTTEDKFWGVTDIVIHRDRLFHDAQLQNTSGEFKFALRGPDGKGKNGDVFWGDPSIFNMDPVMVEIDLPTGNWVLAAAPTTGWSSYINQDTMLSYILIISSLIISILIWLFTNALVKIKNNERELRAIFQSMQGLVIEYDKDGLYKKIAPTNTDLLILPEDQLIGKSVFEVLDSDLAQLFYQSIQECLTRKELVIIEYPLRLKGQLHWFTARISRRNESSVIFNAYDITDKKLSEENILRSENKLKELNAMKDKFFSIIAHDLKNQIGSFMSLTSILSTDYSSFSDEEKSEMIGDLQQASSETYELLNNLLNWALSQQNAVKTDKKPHVLAELCSQATLSLQNLAADKKITLINEVEPLTEISCDKNLTTTIVRNLVSNAIKFTEENGRITLSQNKRTIDGLNYLFVEVTDTGIGMTQEIMDKLFKIDQTKSLRGTRNESGTGLGLILCKEFAEKQGGIIRVSSIPGHGSTFAVGFPE